MCLHKFVLSEAAAVLFCERCAEVRSLNKVARVAKPASTAKPKPPLPNKNIFPETQTTVDVADVLAANALRAKRKVAQLELELNEEEQDTYSTVDELDAALSEIDLPQYSNRETSESNF